MERTTDAGLPAPICGRGHSATAIVRPRCWQRRLRTVRAGEGSRAGEGTGEARLVAGRCGGVRSQRREEWRIMADVVIDWMIGRLTGQPAASSQRLRCSRELLSTETAPMVDTGTRCAVLSSFSGSDHGCILPSSRTPHSPRAGCNRTGARRFRASTARFPPPKARCTSRVALQGPLVTHLHR
jgi:hypothetical protein